MKRKYFKFVSYETGATLIVIRLSLHSDEVNARTLADERIRQERVTGGQVTLKSATEDEWSEGYDWALRNLDALLGRM